MTATYGAAIGQINGLGIYEVHPSEGAFAVPMRISAIVSVGKDESVLDIERVAEQADAEHVRGMMTMEGYLANRYGQDRPVSLAARSLRAAPVARVAIAPQARNCSRCSRRWRRFRFAGRWRSRARLGQYGEIQPIGGVNTKIEGFFDLCRARRAAGEQPAGGYGVIIPAVNTRDLMLRPNVAYSIAQEGWFSIWPINWVD